uniref:Uncharacterized protein n=1 Tax=Timema poppense TaxID=170557 RepID=A0A7R9H0F5_TIMPO|nr:unnamed protein product [Timema poppensis]
MLTSDSIGNGVGSGLLGFWAFGPRLLGFWASPFVRLKIVLQLILNVKTFFPDNTRGVPKRNQTFEIARQPAEGAHCGY